MIFISRFNHTEVTKRQLPNPNASLALRDSAVLQDELEEVTVLSETHKYEVFASPLEYTVDVHHVGVVQLHQDIEFTREELSHEVPWRLHGVYHLACQRVVPVRFGFRLVFRQIHLN